MEKRNGCQEKKQKKTRKGSQLSSKALAAKPAVRNVNLNAAQVLIFRGYTIKTRQVDKQFDYRIAAFEQ
jgi:hypothetical protein